MLMRVIYVGGRYDFVNGTMLTSLLEARAITRFERPDGWVNIDSPYVRRASRKYIGQEKRSAQKANA
jgi:hypothetical protein